MTSSGGDDRYERYVQKINKSGWIVIELHRAVQLLAKRLHHTGAEATPCRMLNRRAAPLGPGQVHPLLFIVGCPSDFDAAIGVREGTEFDSIGAKLVQRHGERNDGARCDPDVRAIEMETSGPLIVIRLGRTAKCMGQAGAGPADLHQQVVGTSER